MDNETQKVFTEGEALSDYIKTKGWGIVKELFTTKILDMQSVMNIKHTSVTDMAREVYARQLAVEILYEVIKDVEGMAEKHQANKELMVDKITFIE